MSIDAYRQKLEMYLQEKEARGEPLPGVRRRVNYTGIAIEAEIPYNLLRPKSELHLLVNTWLGKLEVANNHRTEQPRRTFDSENHFSLTTYGDFKASGLLRLREDGYAKATIASYQSHLNAFMRHFGRTDKSSTAEDFGAYFESRVDTFMKATGSSEAVRSALNLYSTIHYQLRRSKALPSNFAAALNELATNSGCTQNDVARAAGIKPIALVGQWMRGDRKPRFPEQIARLEEVFEVSPGTLSSLIVFRRGAYLGRNIPKDWWPDSWQQFFGNSLLRRKQVIALIPEHLLTGPLEELRPAFDKALQQFLNGKGTLEYRHRLTKVVKKVYCLRYAAWPDHLKAEFLALKAYKTAPSEFGNTSHRGSWEKETVKMAQTNLENFFGFLCLPVDHPDPELRGMGLCPENLTLAWLAVPEVVKQFLNFRRDRAGAYNSATETFVTRWGALLQPKRGWLWRNPQLLSRLPVQQQKEVEAAGGWESFCVRFHTELKGELASLKRRGQIKQTREPMEPIEVILDHPEPLSLINDALNLTRQDLEARTRPDEMFTHRLAVAWRDYLLLCLLARFPLRSKHWGMFTYHEDGSGYLQNHPRDGWRLKIPYEDFKNEDSLSIFTLHSRERVLILKFSDLEPLKQLIPEIEFYLEKAHPILAGGGNFLFPSRNGGALSGNTLYTRVNLWSREYISEYSSRQTGIKGVFPFGPHAFRDIVATHILKTTGSISLAANMLLDSEETVRKHYTRFLPEDRVGLAMAKLAGAFKREEDKDL